MTYEMSDFQKDQTKLRKSAKDGEITDEEFFKEIKKLHKRATETIVMEGNKWLLDTPYGYKEISNLEGNTAYLYDGAIIELTPEEMEIYTDVSIESKASEMRQLTVKQKRLVREWVDSIRNYVTNYISIDNVPDALYEELQSINDTEILPQEIQRYANDYHSKVEFGESKAREGESNSSCPRCGSTDISKMMDDGEVVYGCNRCLNDDSISPKDAMFKATEGTRKENLNELQQYINDYI